MNEYSQHIKKKRDTSKQDKYRENINTKQTKTKQTKQNKLNASPYEQS